MTYTEFVEYLPYITGQVVSYRGALFVFKVDHAPGPWDGSQVTPINVAVPFSGAKFNTLPNYNLSSPLAIPKYRIIYHMNNDAITIEQPVVDTQVYASGAEAIVKNYTLKHISNDGIWCHTFIGWTLAKHTASEAEYTKDELCIIGDHDIHLYGVWSKEPTIEVSVTGEVALLPEYRLLLQTIYIPEYFGGVRLKTIVTNAFSDADLSEIVIPPNIHTIEEDAFKNCTCTSIRFIDSKVTLKYPGLKLLTGCFNNTPNLVSLTLPYRWTESTNRILQNDLNKVSVMNIYIRNTKEYMKELLQGALPDPFDVETFIADASVDTYVRNIYWGYND